MGLEATVPDGYEVVETDQRVHGGENGGFRLRFFAQREVDKLNAGRHVPSYRWAVVDSRKPWPRRRYWPVAFQNVLTLKGLELKGHAHAPR